MATIKNDKRKMIKTTRKYEENIVRSVRMPRKYGIESRGSRMYIDLRDDVILKATTRFFGFSIRKVEEKSRNIW